MRPIQVACLLAPHLAVQVEQHGRPALHQRPLVIGGRPWDAGAVLDCCNQAAAAGVTPGMRLHRAEQLCPTAVFMPAREPAYRRTHEELQATIAHWTPTIETAGLGLLFANVAGLQRIAGTNDQLASQLAIDASNATNLRVQVGLATSKFTAEQAATCTPPGTGRFVKAGQEASFLSSLPLDTLPMDNEMKRRLAMLGIHTLGSLASLPRLALVRQFGPHAGPIHDLASGRDSRPIQPGAPPLVIDRQRSFEDALADHTQLAAHLQAMSAEISETLSSRGYQAEGLQLQLVLEEGAATHPGRAVKPPTADAGRLGRLAVELLSGVPVSSAVTSLTLRTFPLRPAYLGAVQLALLDHVRDLRRERLAEALRQLRRRFGEMIVVVASLLGPPPPSRIQVTTLPDGTPCALVWRERIRPVATVYENWRERRFWWVRPVERDYYRLETAEEDVHIIYREVRSGQWMLERRRQ